MRRHVLCLTTLAILTVGWAFSGTVAAADQVLYVKAGAVGVNDGASWADAYNDLQDALAVAESGDQIWVTTGIYTPASPGSRTAAFQLKSGVGLYYIITFEFVDSMIVTGWQPQSRRLWGW